MVYMKKLILVIPVLALFFCTFVGTSFDANSQQQIDLPANNGAWVYWTINGTTTKSCGGTGTECTK
jgi:invasion protein IalB